jgi:hypothetical protein
MQRVFAGKATRRRAGGSAAIAAWLRSGISHRPPPGLIVGGLTCLPALALGPVAEHLAMLRGTVF